MKSHSVEMDTSRSSRDRPTKSGPAKYKAKKQDGERVVTPDESVKEGIYSISFHRATIETLDAFRTMTSTDVLVLFTPLVPPPSDSPKTGEPIDPFEALGRAMAEHHGRVRHVPFIPETGMTDTHKTFLLRASAVVIALCEPTNELKFRTPEQLFMAGRVSKASIALRGQLHFANMVRKEMAKKLSGNLHGTEVPLIITTTGPPDGMLASEVGLVDFDTILHSSSYHPRVLRRMADTLFGLNEEINAELLGDDRGDFELAKRIKSTLNLEDVSDIKIETW